MFYINEQKIFVRKFVMKIKSKQGIDSGSCWLRNLQYFINLFFELFLSFQGKVA